MATALQSKEESIKKLVSLDLKRFGFSIIDGNVVRNGVYAGSLPECIASIKKETFDSVSILKNTWKSIPIFLAEDSGVLTSEGARILVHCLSGLHRKINSYPILSSIHVSSVVRDALHTSIDRWSDKTAEDISYISIKIYNIEKKIRNGAFVVSAIKYLHENMNKVAQSSGGSVQGAYSNLDLPMAERWYMWQDIDEELEGRRDSIRSQRRYQMGLEDSDPLGTKEGFYWRELRNEPYKFDVLYPDSPYPYRSALWGNP